jgi:hypothetical protein
MRVSWGCPSSGSIGTDGAAQPRTPSSVEIHEATKMQVRYPGSSRSAHSYRAAVFRRAEVRRSVVRVHDDLVRGGDRPASAKIRRRRELA